METQSHGRMITLCFLGICCWNLVVSIDTTCLSVALPTIARDLQATSTQIYWTGTAFVLCSAAFQPVFASYSGAFGRKPVILLALTLFTAGAIVCGVAHDIAVLLVGRCIQGVGGGGLVTMTYVILADLFTVQERSRYIGILSLTWLVGVVCGPVLGGGFTESVTWRWVFWFNLPFCGLIYLVVIFILPNTYKPDQSIAARLRRVDWLGSVLFVGSLTSFLVALSWGGVMFAWSTWHTIVPLVLGIAGLVFWAVYSVYVTAHPMIPIMILRDRSTAINYFCTVIHGMCQFGTLYYLPLYYQAAKSYTPMISGVALILCVLCGFIAMLVCVVAGLYRTYLDAHDLNLPQCAVAGPACAIVGLILARSPRIKAASTLGWVVLALGLGLFTLLSTGTSVPAWVLVSVPFGIGLGILFASLALATQASAEHRADGPPEEKAKIKTMAASLNPFFRALGQAFGIVVGQAAFTNEMKKRISGVAARNAAELVGSARDLPVGDSLLRARLVGSFVDSLKVVWWILFALAVFAGLLTLLTVDVEAGGLAEGYGEQRNDEEKRLGARNLEGSANSTAKWSGVGGGISKDTQVTQTSARSSQTM